MKKLALLLVFALILSVFPIAAAEIEPAFTSDIEYAVCICGDYEYILLEDNTAQITQYTGSAVYLDIPTEIDGYAVTSVGDFAFSYCDLQTVNIPDSIISLGANPFSSCDSLQNIVVSPDHPTLAVFDGVLFDKTEKKLICYPTYLDSETYTIHQSVAAIGDFAFAYCNLTSVTIPESVTAIGDWAFASCTSLTTVTLPESIVSLGSWAFLGCSSLQNISIPKGLLSIGDMVFYGCEALTSAIIPEGVTSIGDEAFDSCTSLTSVTIPGSVTSIGLNAFADCPDLTLSLVRDSYAAQYAKDNGIKYTYPDSLDWLNS